MDTRYIAAIEIGSSKIKGLIASVGELGDITLLAAEETKVSNCVRYGRISNVQEVTLHVNQIIRKLENSPAVIPGKVSAVYLALGGRSFATMAVQASTKLPSAIEITADTVERLKREASFGLVVTDKETLALLPKTFYVDNTQVKNVVGTIGSQIKAEFSALVCAPDNKRNLERIKIETSEQQPKREYVYRPIAQADLVLSPDEKQIGCALIDFGAETTTVSVYKDDVLQAIVTLPMGSRNITRDLMAGLSMTEENAEMAKSTVGSALTEGNETDNAKIEINNYIQARAGEIIANIVHQIEAVGFKAQDLPGGLVFIGGGLGAACRYFSTTHIGALFGTYFPFGTLFVNTLGSLLMGFIMGSLVFLMEKTGFTLAEPARLLLTVGFLGGFTTFSSFSLETVTLIEGGSLFYAAMNIAANLGLCFLATFLGLGAARALSAL